MYILLLWLSRMHSAILVYQKLEIFNGSLRRIPATDLRGRLSKGLLNFKVLNNRYTTIRYFETPLFLCSKRRYNERTWKRFSHGSFEFFLEYRYENTRRECKNALRKKVRIVNSRYRWCIRYSSFLLRLSMPEESLKMVSLKDRTKYGR